MRNLVYFNLKNTFIKGNHEIKWIFNPWDDPMSSSGVRQDKPIRCFQNDPRGTLCDFNGEIGGASQG